MKLIVRPLVFENERRIAISAEGFDPQLKEEMAKLAGCRWSTAHRSWHFATLPALWRQFREMFEGRMEIEVQPDQAITIPIDSTPIPTLRPSDRQVPVVHRMADKLGLYAHPSDQGQCCIVVPAPLIQMHLATVKNITGRRWNADLMAWEVPKSQITRRFLQKYLQETLYYDIRPDDSWPERPVLKSSKYQE